MLIYVAAPWARKSEAKLTADQLRFCGFEVSSSWIDQPEGEYEQSACCKEALRDLEEVKTCDIFVFLNLQLSEGKATELGIALTLGKAVFCVGGKNRNVFLHLPQIQHFATVDDLIAVLTPYSR